MYTSCHIKIILSTQRSFYSLSLIDCSCVHDQCEIITAILFGLGVWVTYVLVRRYTLKLLLMNHSWMYEPFGKISLPNKIWIGLVKLIQGREPLLYGYQSALPKLPVPSLEGTRERVNYCILSGVVFMYVFLLVTHGML